MDDEADKAAVKPLEWIASSRDDLLRFPVPVRKAVGYALYLAQTGEKALAAKPLKGFGGAGVLEIVEDHDGDAYRAVYTVKFAGVVFVLHAFQKKSKKGIATPKGDVELLHRRFKAAAERYQQLYRDKEKWPKKH